MCQEGKAKAKLANRRVRWGIRRSSNICRANRKKSKPCSESQAKGGHGEAHINPTAALS